MIPDDNQRSFSRVTACIVVPDCDPAIPFANEDADALAKTLRATFDLPVTIHLFKGPDASTTAVCADLQAIIATLTKDDLFIFSYTGHAVHDDDGNRLSTTDATLHLKNDLLAPITVSACRQTLLLIDATGDLDLQEFAAVPVSAILSCASGERSHTSATLKHGVWAHHLIAALPTATDDHALAATLAQQIPRFLTREMKVRETQTPRAILQDHKIVLGHATTTVNSALAGIALRNRSEYLEGTETGDIRRLDGFTRGQHKVPTQITASVDAWCQRLLTTKVADELQQLYTTARQALNAKRKDLQKAEDTGAGDLDTAAFRYAIETGQNPDDPASYIIRRRLELRQGWDHHRAAIDAIFGAEFDRLVVEFESIGETFDDLVDQLEDIQQQHGGTLDDDDRSQRVTYQRNGVRFTFDLTRRRLEIAFGPAKAMDLIDAAQKIQLGLARSSPLLAAATAKPGATG